MLLVLGKQKTILKNNSQTDPKSLGKEKVNYCSYLGC